MFAKTAQYFVSWFSQPSLIGIALAIAFGAVWLLCYWPSLFRHWWLWVVMVVSAFLTLAAVCFIQIPLQVITGQAIGQQFAMKMPLIAGAPGILYSGLVQEGAKLLPIIVLWFLMGRDMSPRFGLAAGAIAGTGFAVFEAQWVHNIVFASGWNLAALQSGVVALAAFWERFFVVGMHIAVSALAGYGLARGRGWQFFLIAAFIHALVNYSTLLLQTKVWTMVHVEIFIAVIALLASGVALWLRWNVVAQEPEI